MKPAVSLDNTPLYIRGFSVSTVPLTHIPGNFTRTPHNALHVYIDRETHVVRAARDACEIIIFGVVIDSQKPKLTPEGIASKLIRMLSKGRRKFFEGLYTIGGRYAILARDQDGYLVVGDAGGVRSICYSASDQGCYVSSHAALIAEQTGADLNPLHSNIQTLGDTTTSKARNWPGRQSRYQGVSQLTANTCLHFPACTVERFFPLERLPVRSPRRAARIAAKHIKNSMRALERNYAQNDPHPFLIFLTSGIDSRIVLSGTKEHAGKTQALSYRVSKAHNADVRVSEELSRIAGMPFNQFEAIEGGLKPTQDWALKNGGGVFTGSRAVINQLARDFSNYRFSLRGNLGEISRGVYLGKRQFLNDIPRFMANIWFRGAEEHGEIIQAFADYAEAIQIDRAKWPLRILYYWEHRHGTWHAATANTLDAALDTFNIMNNRAIIEAMCGVTDEEQKKASVHKEVIRRLYPEILSIDINPKH